MDSSSGTSKAELNILYQGITNVSNSSKDAKLREPLNLMYGVYEEYLSDDELQRIDDRAERYDINFDDITVEELRIRIQTFNNLVVRLPVDTKHNKMASKHIFRDWKAFVDGAVDYLVGMEKLFVGDESQGLGTDGLLHWFKELYIDESKSIPLMDYSYICKGEDFEHPYIDEKTGKPVADRWDYWSESDFD